MAEDLIDAAGFPGDIAAETTVTPLSPPGYELLDEIGHGGMGVVYRARDVALDRDVALKLLSERYLADSPAAQRFLSEARITGQLQHPGIPAVHQVGTLADGRPFLAMKLIKGSTLEVILKQRSDPSAERGRLLAIFEAVCQAVGYAHAHRVIHRDLKPANVMVGAFGEVQVMDWGLAKVLGEETPATVDAGAAELTRAWTQVSPTPETGSYTQAGSLVGTPAFIPPEQAGGEIERVNERADVFGLGALLSVILTGQPPYVGETFESVRVQALRGKLDDCLARLDGSGAEPELVALCKRCLAFEPGNRPADAGAVAAAVAALRAAADERARQAELERVRAEGETREALALAAEQRRRRRTLLTASGVIALVFLAGFAGVFWQWRVAETARADEKSQRDRAEQSQKEAEQSQKETEKALAIVESQKSEVEGSLAKAEAAEEQGRKLLYTADMQLAPFVWKDGRSTTEQLRTLLAKHIPNERIKDEGGKMNTTGDGPDSSFIVPPSSFRRSDLRGFEWYYYRHLLESSAAVFSGHDVPVIAGAFTSDGQLVTLDQDGQVRRWDLGSQQEDESRRRDLPGGPRDQVRVLSPDGRLVALAEANKVRVFDISTGQETCQIDSADDHFRRLIFSPDSASLVIVDDRIRWLSAVSGELVAAVDHKFDGEMAGRSTRSLALSADGLTLAVVGHGIHDHQFSIFRLDETAKKVTPLAKDAGFNGTLSAAALSPDGQLIALGHLLTGGLRVFDTATGRSIAQPGWSTHASPISAMAFSGDGAKLATADAEGTIKIWADAQKLTSKSAALVTLKGHQGRITAVRFSSDGKRLVTTSADKTARVWDLENAATATRPLERSPGWCVVARFSSDGQWIAAADGNRVLLWDAATGRLARELAAADNSNNVFSVAFSPTDSRLLAVGYGRLSYVALWDIDTGTELVRLPGASDLDDFSADVDRRVIGALAFSPNGKYLVAGFGQKYWFDPTSSPIPLKVWEVADRRLIRRLDGHTGFCLSLDFSRDGTLLASGSRDGTAILWSTETWTKAQTLENPDNESLSGRSGRGMVEGVSFSPDGKILALASREGDVQLWDVASGKLLETLKGHSSAVLAVAFSPDGRTLASGGTDQAVRLWNVPTRRQLMQLDPGSIELGQVLTLAFSPDGKQLLAGGSSGAAFWSAAPSVSDDSSRAAEKLRLLLESNANFQSRVSMLPANRRLLESLEKLEKIFPEDVRVHSALAATQARYFAEQGDELLADAARAKACALLEQQLAAEPDNRALASQLADLLLPVAENDAWTVLKPIEAKSDLGANLSILADNSILASGENLINDRYHVVLIPPAAVNVAAVRLEALTHPSLPGNGPGRTPAGSFAQASWNVTAASLDRKEPVRLDFDRALADREIAGYPTNSWGHWNISISGEGRNCTAFWSASKPVSLEPNATLIFEMQFFQEINGAALNLGRFRLSVSDDPTAFDREQKRLAAMRLTDPWAKLAAAYRLIGDQPALERLAERHPAFAASDGDLYADQQDWERAIAEYSKHITGQTADANVMAKRAAAYEATQRWDLARADWLRAIEQQPSIAQAAFDSYRQAERWKEAAEFGLILAEQKPSDSLVWLSIAPVVVLAGDDADYPAYCRRIVEQFAKSKDFDVPEKVVKACLLRREAIELAKLPVDRFAASLDEGSAPDWYPVWAWGTRALLAYRSGDAESAVKYVAKSEELKLSDLLHALNLVVLAMAEHQLQHSDEAHRALAEAVRLTDRLQRDANSKGDFNLLIAQILVREAHALINGKPEPMPGREETEAAGDKTP